ncbi:MAG: GTPase Era [bacterium]|nr:GTPase Era [bacterium]
MQRAGFVAIVGAPNAGKSTLTNRLVGHKVAIVTHKVQTTRRRILGIVVRESTQIILMDTPGIFEAKKPLERAMVKAAWSAPKEADMTVVLVDTNRKNFNDVHKILATLERRETQHLVLCLNKVDQVSKEKLLDLAADLSARAPIERVFMISALDGSGVQDLEKYLTAQLPEGPWLYPEDQMTDLPQRNMAEEVVREKVFLNLHQELPYAITVQAEQWGAKEDGSALVHLTLYVERSGQKAIVLGKKGETIKRMGIQAREDLEGLFGHKIHLKLFVKVDKDWASKRSHYEAMGLEFKS